MPTARRHKHTQPGPWRDGYVFPKKRKKRRKKRSSGLASTSRTSRVAVTSTYSTAKKPAPVPKKVPKKAKPKPPPVRLHSRTVESISEHYTFHKLFSMDATGSGIEDAISGHLRESATDEAEFADAFIDAVENESEGVMEREQRVLLSLEIPDLNVVWTLKRDSDGIPYYVADIDIPNADRFDSITARISVRPTV